MEAQLSAHIRHLLLDYVRCHITTDYVQFTEAALISLEEIPEYDPASLTLPSDPYSTLARIHNLDNLPPLHEKFATTQDALQFLRNSITPPEGQTKSECFSWSKDAWDEFQNDAFERVEPILTRRAVRETPVLGKSGGAHRAPAMQKADLDSFARFMTSKPIAFEPVSAEPVQETQVKLDQVLDVTFNLKAADHTAVRAYLQSVATVCRPQLATHIDIKKDYRRAYLPAGFVFDPPPPPASPQDSPPLTPVFARSARYGCNQDVKSGVLHSYAELPERLGVTEKAKILDSDEDMDLARASMIVVDGWQTYAVSSPTSVSSADDEFDELADMFPSSPDTSVIDAMNLVEDVENSKLDEVQIPRNRRIGGSLGLLRESIIDKAQKAGGLGAFLMPLLKPSEPNSETISTSDMHPLLHDKMSALSRGVDLKSSQKDSGEELSSKIAEQDLDSMCGQASIASSFGGCATTEDHEIRGLYLDSSCPGKGRLGPPLPRVLPDPKALIRDEPLFEEETKEVREKNALAPKLMPVPMLSDPNVGIERSARGYSDYLIGPHNPNQRDEHDVKAGRTTSLLRFLKNTKGMAPLRVALSWVPFTYTIPIPVHAGLLQNDLEVEETIQNEADTLLKVCTELNVGAEGCGFGDERRWRGCSGRNETVNEFSEEIARCEIILTRKERKALLARERGMVEDECEIDEGSEDELGKKRKEKIKTTKTSEQHKHRYTKTPSQVLGRCEQDEYQDDHRPLKRARMSADDSGIGLMLELDGPLHFDNQDDSLDTTNKMPQGSYQDDDLMMKNDLNVDYNDKNMKRTIGSCNHTDAFFTNTDYCSSNSMLVEDELRGRSQQELSRHSESSLLDEFNRPYTETTEATEATEEPFSFTRDGDSMSHLDQTSTDAPVEIWDRNNLGNYMTVNLHVPQDVAIESGRHVVADDEGHHRSSSYKDTSLQILNSDLASHSLKIEAFARLRAKTITNNLHLTDKPTGIDNPQERDEPLPRILHRTTPPDLYDDKTVQMPLQFPQPRTIHKYMASVDLLQKRVLVRSLASECLIELVDRDSLGGADLIIDPHTAVNYTCLFSLPAHGNKLLERLSAQSWRYKRVLIVFEAYPESRSFRQGQKQGLTDSEPELNAYTPPIVKAIKRFRRDLAIAEGCGKKSVACDVWCAFPNSVKEAAIYTRLFGDEAERADCTEGALWGSREWLDADESEEEKDLALINGMNHFSAAIVLFQMTLQVFLDVGPEERLAMVGPLIGNDAIAAFNLEIEERLQVIDEDATDVISVKMNRTAEKALRSEIAQEEKDEQTRLRHVIKDISSATKQQQKARKAGLFPYN
ncbi:hypothetical protein C0992_006331 [Termitomyces sp. T32_za158]|nr:hypothetical protein C0992_006331 [Termitomyces sp. T32_za158]